MRLVTARESSRTRPPTRLRAKAGASGGGEPVRQYGEGRSVIASSGKSSKQQRAVLLILLATCERALEALQVAENPVDEDFTADLERIIARTKKELEAAAGGAAEPT